MIRGSGAKPGRSRLRCGLCAAAAAGPLVLTAAAPAVAGAPPQRPTPQQLWKSYPLDPAGAKRSPTATTPTRAPVAKPPVARSRATTATTTVGKKPVDRPRLRGSVPVAPRREATSEHGRTAGSLVVAGVATATMVLLLVLAGALAFAGTAPRDGRRRRAGRRRGQRVPAPAPAAPDLRLAPAATAAEPPAEDMPDVAVLRAKLDEEPAAAKMGDAEPLRAKAAPPPTAAEVDALKAKLADEPPPKLEDPHDATADDVDVLRTKGVDAQADTVDVLLAKLQPTERIREAAVDRPLLRPVPAPAAPPVRPLRAGGRRRLTERCRVHWWRGYVKSQFYAASSDDDDGQAIAFSPRFRWHKIDVPPEREPATTALGALVEQLERDGWRRVGRGDEWFELRFRRRLPRDAEPERPDMTATKGT